jgi:hypothetical protein
MRTEPFPPFAVRDFAPIRGRDRRFSASCLHGRLRPTVAAASDGRRWVRHPSGSARGNPAARRDGLGRSGRAGGRLAAAEPGHLHLRMSPALVPLVVGRQPRLTPLLPADASLGVLLRCSRQRLGFGSMNSVLSCHRGSSHVRSALPHYRSLDELAGECVPVSLSIRINERLRFGLPWERTNKPFTSPARALRRAPDSDKPSVGRNRGQLPPPNRINKPPGRIWGTGRPGPRGGSARAGRQGLVASHPGIYRHARQQLWRATVPIPNSPRPGPLRLRRARDSS